MKSLAILFLCLLSLSSQAKILGTQESLFEQRDNDNYNKSPEEIYNESLQTYRDFIKTDLQELQHNSVKATDEGKTDYITLTQAKKVYAALISNPVVSSNSAKKNYDPYARTGFCFGRAMFVNLYLAQSGLSRASIKKVFILGSMDGGVWGWHVATTVKSRDSRTNKLKWLVIDSEVGKVVELVEWYNYWRNGSSDDKKLRLYITEAGRFGATPSRYDEDGIKGAYYNDYFNDMMSWFNRDFKADLF